MSIHRIVPHRSSIFHIAVAVACNASYPFDLQLHGETIVSSQSSSNQTLGQLSEIISLAETLSEIWDHGFRIPLGLHRVIASNTDFASYASLTKMFDKSESNVHDWYRFAQNRMDNFLLIIFKRLPLL